jgi:hypothetical protein
VIYEISKSFKIGAKFGLIGLVEKLPSYNKKIILHQYYICLGQNKKKNNRKLYYNITE